MTGDSPDGRFRRIASAGILFQGGAAAVDSSIIIAALVHALTGSALAVGAASAILRYGWLFPQIFVGFLAQRRRRRMPLYAAGAFGRATCLALLAGPLALAGSLPPAVVIALFFVTWTAYAFVSGIVAVPYNDIVARAVPSARRSRLLAIRFFGGGLLALGVAWVAHHALDELDFPDGYAVNLHGHQPLGREADHLAQKVGVRTLFQQRAQRHHVVGGHRGSPPVGWTLQAQP